MSRARGKRVRRVASDSLHLVQGLDRIIFPADAHLTLTELEDVTWWLVYDGPAPVAFGGAAPVRGTDAWEFVRAGVVPWARGEGLQRRLVRARERSVRAAGARRAITYTMADNVWSMNTLIRCGWRTYEPALPWAGLGDVVYWYRVLR